MESQNSTTREDVKKVVDEVKKDVTHTAKSFFGHVKKSASHVSGRAEKKVENFLSDKLASSKHIGGNFVFKHKHEEEKEEKKESSENPKTVGDYSSGQTTEKADVEEAPEMFITTGNHNWQKYASGEAESEATLPTSDKDVGGKDSSENPKTVGDSVYGLQSENADRMESTHDSGKNDVGEEESLQNQKTVEDPSSGQTGNAEVDGNPGGSETQPLVVVFNVHRRASWMNCCGLLDCLIHDHDH